MHDLDNCFGKPRNVIIARRDSSRQYKYCSALPIEMRSYRLPEDATRDYFPRTINYDQRV